VEGCAGTIFAVMRVAIVPVALAFALLKSARVSTAGARARYHGSTRRVFSKASSVDLSQDARATASEGESNCDSCFVPEYQRGRAGDETAKPRPIALAAVRLRTNATLPPVWSVRDGHRQSMSRYLFPSTHRQSPVGNPLFQPHKSERVPHVRTSVRGSKKTGRPGFPARGTHESHVCGFL
jgi:hypothetical protein